MHTSTIVLFSYIIEYVSQTHSSTSQLNGPSEVAAKHAGCGGVAGELRGHLRLAPLNPENLLRTWLTESDGRNPRAVVGVLWGPVSLLFAMTFRQKPQR